MVPKQLARLANDAADGLGHNWIGIEHFVLAILHPSTESPAKDALNACGVSYEVVRICVSELPASYSGARGLEPPATGRLLGSDALQFIGRADGLAIGMGSLAILPEHLLMSVVWDPADSVAICILERCGATRKSLLEALRHSGVAVPLIPLKAQREWSEFSSVPAEDVQRVSLEYQRLGRPYRIAFRGDEILLSIAQ